jgi:hypothetical protein
MTQNKFKPFLPVIFFFIGINAVTLTGSGLADKWSYDKDVIMVGNLVLFLATFLSYFFALRGIRNNNPHTFVRSVYASIMVKFFICLLAALIYIMMYKANLNKPALFICMGLYLIYTFMEVMILTKIMKQKTNA